MRQRPHLLHRIGLRLGVFRQAEDGSATIEFVILFPILMVIFLSTVESGIMMLRHAMLERGVDMALRTLRLNTGAPPNFAQLKSQICNYAGIINDCNSNLQMELVQIDTATWTLGMNTIRCIDRNNTINPVTQTTYQPGAINSLMVLRVCAIVDPIFPGTGLGTILPVDATGGYALVTIASFVNEPT